MFDGIQRHALARELALPASAKALWQELRSALVRESDAGHVTTSLDDINKHLRLLREPPASVRDHLRDRDLHAGAACIVFGPEKNQARDLAMPHVARDDGAWFDFTITVREGGGALELLAYDFEIRFPPEMGAPFLRFDLNLPGHRNEDRELRCHVHPGSDEVILPAPLMSPRELIDLCVHGVRLPQARAGRRAPTAFEVSWYADKHARGAT